jgi:hypothetical protein
MEAGHTGGDHRLCRYRTFIFGNAAFSRSAKGRNDVRREVFKTGWQMFRSWRKRRFYFRLAITDIGWLSGQNMRRHAQQQGVTDYIYEFGKPSRGVSEKTPLRASVYTDQAVKVTENCPFSVSTYDLGVDRDFCVSVEV